MSSLWFPGCCLRYEACFWAHIHCLVCLHCVSVRDRECASAHILCLCETLFLSALAATCACAWGCVIRAALELYKKSLTVKTIVQTPWFQRCSTTACAARADWTGALERGRETSGSQHPVAAHLPLSLLLPSVSFVRRKGFEHQRAAMLPWRQKQLVRDLVKGGIEENPIPQYSKNISGHCWAELYSKDCIPQRDIVYGWHILEGQNILSYQG